MIFRRWALIVLAGAGWILRAAEPNVAIVLNADARAAAQPLRHGWSAGATGGSVSQALRATWQDHWRIAAAECGFGAVELTGVFDPALGIYRRDGEKDRFDFTALDDLFDRLVAANTHPYLRLEIPPAVATEGRMAPFLTQWVQHCEDRYGMPELRQWYFEIEPGNAGLATAAAAAIKAIDPQLRVGAPLHPLLGTTGTSLKPDYTRDGLPAAALILRQTLETKNAAAGLSFGMFSDQAEGATERAGIFHGGPGLITAQGVVKPSFHAYRYLNALGDEVLATAPGGIVSRRKNSGRVVLLAYNVPPEQTLPWSGSATMATADQLAGSGSARTLSINLSGLRPGGQILIEMLEINHGNASEAWQRLGSPAEPTRPALAALQSGAREMRLEYRQADELGRVAYSRSLPPWAVLLLREL